MGRGSTETCFFRPFRALLALSWLPWARRPLSESVAENPNPDMWLLAGSQPHALHSLKRFFWRRPIVINHFGGKGASPALPSTPPFTQAPRSHPRPKALGFRIGASTVSSAVAGPNPRSPTTKPEFQKTQADPSPLKSWRLLVARLQEPALPALARYERPLSRTSKRRVTGKTRTSLPRRILHYLGCGQG